MCRSNKMAGFPSGKKPTPSVSTAITAHSAALLPLMSFEQLTISRSIKGLPLVGKFIFLSFKEKIFGRFKRCTEGKGAYSEHLYYYKKNMKRANFCGFFASVAAEPRPQRKRAPKISLRGPLTYEFWCGWQELNPRPLGS